MFNWFTIIGTLIHVVNSNPELIGEVRQFFEQLHAKQPAPDHLADALNRVVAEANQS